MEINDTLLTVGAITLELGFPAVLIILCFLSPSKRPVFIPVLGAVTPMLCAYAYGTVGYFLVSREEYEYGFLVMWAMSFVIYCLLVIVGLIVGKVLRSGFSNLFRYWVAFIIGPLVGLGVVWLF